MRGGNLKRGGMYASGPNGPVGPVGRDIIMERFLVTVKLEVKGYGDSHEERVANATKKVSERLNDPKQQNDLSNVKIVTVEKL